MKKLIDVPFDKIYVGLPVVLPATSIYQNDPRCGHYGETLYFNKRIGIVKEVLNGIKKYILIKFEDSDFIYSLNYDYKKSTVVIDPTRM